MDFFVFMGVFCIIASEAAPEFFIFALTQAELLKRCLVSRTVASRSCLVTGCSLSCRSELARDHWSGILLLRRATVGAYIDVHGRDAVPPFFPCLR